jgi:hypothetical protein
MLLGLAGLIVLEGPADRPEYDAPPRVILSYFGDRNTVILAVGGDEADLLRARRIADVNDVHAGPGTAVGHALGAERVQIRRTAPSLGEQSALTAPADPVGSGPDPGHGVARRRLAEAQDQFAAREGPRGIGALEP